MLESVANIAVLIGLAFIAVVVMVSWLIRHGIKPVRKALPSATPSPPAPSPANVPRPERLRLAPEYRCSPLWDDDHGNTVDMTGLGLSAELVDRIADWDAVFQAAFREDDPSASGFSDIAAEHAWVRQGNIIAQDLGREWPGPVQNLLSGLTMLVRDARRDLGPWDSLPADRLAAIGEKCGLAEIEAALVWLDDLARERDALPEWDGDSQDDIAKAQEMLHGILASVPDRYIGIVAGGLHSPEWGTRVHIARALAGQDHATALPILREALTRETDETARQLIAMALADAESEGK